VPFHDAVADFSHSGPWRFFPVAGPSTPLFELAFIAWSCVPLWRDVGPAAAAGRLQVIAATYGTLDARQILHAVPPRIQTMLEGIPADAE